MSYISTYKNAQKRTKRINQSAYFPKDTVEVLNVFLDTGHNSVRFASHFLISHSTGKKGNISSSMKMFRIKEKKTLPQ